jgi:hypothetical protein
VVHLTGGVGRAGVEFLAGSLLGFGIVFVLAVKSPRLRIIVAADGKIFWAGSVRVALVLGLFRKRSARAWPQK